MSKDSIKWESKEDKVVRPREERFLSPVELYNHRKGSHSRTKAASKLEKHVTAFEKEVERRRELENKRLLRRISEINRRKSSLGQGDDEQQRRIYTLNMVSRKWQREKQEQTLQQQNDIMVERIVRMRSYNGALSILPHQELSKSQQRRNSDRSLLLPRIE
jgi:hypothetical protein